MIKHIKLLTIIITVLLLSNANLFSIDVIDRIPEEPRDRIISFFKFMQSGNFDEAFNLLFSKISVVIKKGTKARLLEQMNKAYEDYGEMKGYEAISVDSVTRNYIRAVFISFQIEFPLRWMYVFYKSPVKGWILIDVTLDNKVDKLFKTEN